MYRLEVNYYRDDVLQAAKDTATAIGYPPEARLREAAEHCYAAAWSPVRQRRTGPDIRPIRRVLGEKSACCRIPRAFAGFVACRGEEGRYPSTLRCALLA